MVPYEGTQAIDADLIIKFRSCPPRHLIMCGDSTCIMPGKMTDITNMAIRLKEMDLI